VLLGDWAAIFSFSLSFSIFFFHVGYREPAPYLAQVASAYWRIDEALVFLIPIINDDMFPTY
jgi:hypothetical protein